MLTEYALASDADSAWSQTMQQFTDRWNSVTTAVLANDLERRVLSGEEHSTAPTSNTRALKPNALCVESVSIRLQVLDDFLRLLFKRHWLIRGYVAAARKRYMQQETRVSSTFRRTM